MASKQPGLVCLFWWCRVKKLKISAKTKRNFTLIILFYLLETLDYNYSWVDFRTAISGGGESKPRKKWVLDEKTGSDIFMP